MLDTHTLTDTTDTLLVLLTLLARDLLMLKLKLSQKLGMVLMDTDMLDTHMLELTDTHMPTELTSSVRDPLMLKLSQKLGMVLMDMDMLHTATDTPDTHTVTPDTHTLMDTESRLVKFLLNHYQF